jgi:hypothetical protein
MCYHDKRNGGSHRKNWIVCRLAVSAGGWLDETTSLHLVRQTHLGSESCLICLHPGLRPAGMAFMFARLRNCPVQDKLKKLPLTNCAHLGAAAMGEALVSYNLALPRPGSAPRATISASPELTQ